MKTGTHCVRRPRSSCELALSGGGFVSLVYTDNKIAEKYVVAWQEAIENGDPVLALAQTVEIRTLSNTMIGLIILHRVIPCAWLGMRAMTH